MEVYNVDVAKALRKNHNRARMFFILLVCVTPSYFAIEFVLERIWHNPPTSSLTDMAIKAILFGLLMSAFQSSRTFMLSVTKSWANYQIVLEEDEITTRNFNSGNWMLRKTIRRGEIRTFLEKEQGLLISSRGQFATRLVFGGIWIPNHLADYEYLKRVLLTWRAEGSF